MILCLWKIGDYFIVPCSVRVFFCFFSLLGKGYGGADVIGPTVRTGGGGGGWRYTPFVHGRSRVTVDPRILLCRDWGTSGFDQPGRHCLHQARSAVAKRREVFGESHEG